MITKIFFNIQILKYFFNGIATATIEFFIFFILINYFDFLWYLAQLFSILIAILFNFYICKKYIFKSNSEFTQLNQYLLFITISFATIMINFLILYLFIEVFLFNIYLSKIISMASMFMINFFMKKIIVFNDRD